MRRSVLLSKLMPPHTITEPRPDLSYSRMFGRSVRSPGRLHTRTLPSHEVRENLDSSVKSVRLQCRSCQFPCSRPNLNLACLWWICKRRARIGLLALRLCSLNLFLTVWSLISTPSAILSSFCRSEAVEVRRRRAEMTKNLSWFLVVFRFLPWPCLLFYSPVSLCRLMALYMTDTEKLRSAAIWR